MTRKNLLIAIILLLLSVLLSFAPLSCEAAEAKKEVSEEVVFAFVRFYANRGQMQECVAYVMKYLELLTSTVEAFQKTMNLLVSVAGRDISLITDAAGTSNAKGESEEAR